MTRYFLYILLATTIISCKKKEQSNNTTSEPSTPQETLYGANLRTNFMLTRNGSSFDTSFIFEGKYEKIIGSSHTWLPFSTTNYNGYTANAANNFNGEILSSPNFLQLANKSTWNVTSSEYGNFQYTDSVPALLISTGYTKIPTTYDASQGIPVKIAGFQTGSNIILLDKSQLYFPWNIKMYTGGTYPSTLDTIRDTIRALELSDVPINTNFTLSINCSWGSHPFINGNQSYVGKSTNYFYSIKRIN
ncbi:MAG TPA: hypothetical protein PKZ75_10060 [Bacteroidia bacterium]|nr:hypothetical protein [Bacteroidia bacterium]